MPFDPDKPYVEPPVFTDDQIAALEKAGEVRLLGDHRRRVDTLARFWISDLGARLSARPGDFRKYLDKMATPLGKALKALKAQRLNEGDATELERHLLHWILEEDPGVLGDLGTLEGHIELVLEKVAGLKRRLPGDPGKARPYEDERRLMELVDIFEAAGGIARVYNDTKDRISDTAFRRFAQEFYRLLPADDKRNRGGLDKVLLDVLQERSRSRRSP